MTAGYGDFEDRRISLDPHPPAGMIERRHCSDHECMQARQKWFEETLLPRLTNHFWRGISVTVVSLSAALFFIVRALINQHTLEVERIYDSKFVKTEIYKEDLRRIERKVESLEETITDSLQDVLKQLEDMTRQGRK